MPPIDPGDISPSSFYGGGGNDYFLACLSLFILSGVLRIRAESILFFVSLPTKNGIKSCIVFLLLASFALSFAFMLKYSSFIWSI